MGEGDGNRKGTLTVEGGGILMARSLYISAHTVHVDSAGTITLDGQGTTEGLGTGNGLAGGSYGGRGGLSTSGENCLVLSERVSVCACIITKYFI